MDVNGLASCSLDASDALEWDEIANLTADSTKPAETLMNVVALIARRFGTDVWAFRRICWSRTRESRAGCHGGSASGARRQFADECERRLDGTGCRAGTAGGRRAGEESSSVQVLSRGGRGFVSVIFQECPSSIAECCKACWWCRRWRLGFFRKMKFDYWREAAKRVAPVVSEARMLDRFVAPVQERSVGALARNMWWSWDSDAGQFVPGFGSATLAAS